MEQSSLQNVSKIILSIILHSLKSWPVANTLAYFVVTTKKMFKTWLKEFDVVAVDLSPSPAARDVFRCDFVSVAVSEKVGENDRIVVDESGRIKSICSDSFDSVVFCLLLEYLPTPRLRFKVSRKAWEVLKVGGLFVIVTPDSSHQGKNLDQVFYKNIPHSLCQKGFQQCWARSVNEVI
jgi:25S rRNA (adenine2142-N1)-methyltransferase